MVRGKLITFEGGEGSGKTTQIKRLEARLKAEGKSVLLCREPGGTRLSELIRSLLKDELTDPPCSRSELLLFLAARAQLVKNVIEPALTEGKWVICDRFSDSTFAYQGYGRELPLDILRIINDFACEGLTPNLTLLLDVPFEVSIKRMRSREALTNTKADRIEQAGEAFHRRLRDGFLEIAQQEPNRIKIIDASLLPDEVEEAVWKNLQLLN